MPIADWMALKYIELIAGGEQCVDIVDYVWLS